MTHTKQHGVGSERGDCVSRVNADVWATHSAHSLVGGEVEYVPQEYTSFSVGSHPSGAQFEKFSSQPLGPNW